MNSSSAGCGPRLGTGGVNSVMGLTQQLRNQDGAGQHMGLPRDDAGILAAQAAGNWLQGEMEEDTGESLVGR